MTNSLVPPRGPQRVLAVAQLTNAVGDGAFLVTSALYFTYVVGLAPARVGLGLTLAWAVGAAAGVPLGKLADRRGARGTAVLLAVVAGLAVAAFLFVRGFVPFVVAACVYAAAQSGLAAARQTLLAGLVSAGERTGLLAHLQSAFNAGLAVGAGLGGLALQAGTRAAYLGVFALDVASFAVCAGVLLRLPSAAPGAGGRGGRKDNGGGAVGERRGRERHDGGGVLGDRRDRARIDSRGVLRDRRYVAVAVLNTVLLLRMPLLSLALPLWIAERTDAPAWLVSALFVLNTGAVMLFQVRMARGVTGLSSATRAVRRSGWVMLAACAVFALSAGAPAWVAAGVLVAGAVLQVVAEMGQSAGAWQLSFDLAPADRVGEYQGFFGTGVTVARTLGPLVLTTLLLGWGTAGWLVLGGATLVASYAMGPMARRGGAAAGPDMESEVKSAVQSGGKAAMQSDVNADGEPDAEPRSAALVG
ncbi:MFS transporter [Streptomyces sp. Act143]|uniref:MFS transporter n=1 Tax=Streptomyces sp. Act143 TaxID=2200760 RepID=UPI000D679C88|nr:MFS transporter [Streptomyces sp. Act143]PWI16605.1 MFS transporter [Streptomyces sp. Act143]